MPQLHLYLPKHKVLEVQRRASSKGISVSAYLAELVSSSLETGWPEGYFDRVVGNWQGEPLVRSPQGEFEVRDSLDG